MDSMNPYPIHVSFNLHGLKVLVVDNNSTSLFLTSKMLQSCHYQVTACTHPTQALMLLRNGELKFDIVVTEVHFSPQMNGIKFLEIVRRETDLPVVIISAEDRIGIMIKYITEGACAYLPKPVSMDVIRLLWQHVARKEILSLRQINDIVDDGGEPNSSLSGEDKEFCGSSDGVQAEDDQIRVCRKKQRLVWTDDLHQKFVDAVKQLGIRNAVPKKVLELMNVPGLSRGHVASHLQKYRLNLGKITTHMDRSFTGTGSSMIQHNGPC